MASPFSKNRGPVLKCKRDTHDLSFQNNLTLKFGYLYPCMCKEVSAGDSWHISPAFGLRFLPTYFPLQTKMKAKLDFFYVRNRNLWKDWKNYRFGTGNPSSFPILSDSEALEQSKTGSLGDYLGLPSTVVGKSTVVARSKAVLPITDSSKPFSGTNFACDPVDGSDTVMNLPDNTANKQRMIVYNGNINGVSCSFTLGDFSNFHVVHLGQNSYRKIDTDPFPSNVRTEINNGNIVPCIYFYNENFILMVGQKDFILDSDGRLMFKSISTSMPDSTPLYLVFYRKTDDNIQSLISLSDLPSIKVREYESENLFGIHEATDLFTKIPYGINALPFRAYEQIYNAFYRDDRNNPFMVNDVYDPNIFIPTMEGGSDSTAYRLRKRNWEQDFLTSAVPNPQFGNAPLVGITSSASGVATLQMDDGSTVETQLQYDENDKVVGFSATSSADANKRLFNLASSGISINDLRAVNSLQKYLELHYRRGLRYRDQMFAHRGIEIGYDELDMPEFIGSVVQSIDVSQINQTSASNDSDPLGSYAGQLSAVGGSERMSKYCDEDGIIIGLLSVVPVPAYSQLLPKLFTKINDPLEYFDPSFRNLGYQAIPYREVCPLQAANEGISLDSTFGYNRAWYDYLQSQDEIHGQFRTTLNNYVMARVFNSVPSLTPAFLTVEPNDLNDVFSVSEVTLDDGTKVQLDTILGQVHFNISVERQIPAYAIPSIE